MGKYTTTHACGHTSDTVQLFGKLDQREYTLSQIAKRNCPSCAAASAKSSADPTLPALTGSDKQIAWAYQIRSNAISRHPDTAQLRDVTSAKWFIDHRFDF